MQQTADRLAAEDHMWDRLAALDLIGDLGEAQPNGGGGASGERYPRHTDRQHDDLVALDDRREAMRDGERAPAE